MISVDQSKYRNLNIAAKRVIQIIDKVLLTRNIKNVSIIFQTGNVKTGSIKFPLDKFRQFMNNSISFAEVKKYISYEKDRSELEKILNIISKILKIMVSILPM